MCLSIYIFIFYLRLSLSFIDSGKIRNYSTKMNKDKRYIFTLNQHSSFCDITNKKIFLLLIQLIKGPRDTQGRRLLIEIIVRKEVRNAYYDDM